jgi:hypothetical protein
MTYTVPNTVIYPQTFFGMTLEEIQGYIRRSLELGIEVEELKRKNEELQRNAESSAKRAKELLNVETGAYEIPLSKPGRIEYPDVEVSEYAEEPAPRVYSTETTGGSTSVINVTLDRNRTGKPGTFSWGPQTKEDYEATEEYRRSGYGAYQKVSDDVEQSSSTKCKVEMVTVFEVSPDLTLWDAIEEGKVVETSLRLLEG